MADDRERAELERRAYLALQAGARSEGAAENWRTDLARLMRSADPLGPEIREALALAFEGDFHGFRLDLHAPKGERKRRHDAFNGLHVRRQRIEIGRWILRAIEDGMGNEAAIRAASELPRTGWPAFKGCEGALTYTKRLDNWRASLAPDSALAALGDALEDFFHMRDSEGQPLDRPPNADEVE